MPPFSTADETAPRLIKVLNIPYFPMVAETNVRQGFLTDEQYAKLRDALPEYLRPLFVTAYFTGVRLVNCFPSNGGRWTGSMVSLPWIPSGRKSGHARAVPIPEGDVETWLKW